MGKYLRTYIAFIVIVIPLLVSIVGTIVSLATSFSLIGRIAALGFLLAVIIACAAWLRPVLLMAPSGHRLLEAVQLEGVEDVISRGREQYSRPPAAIFASNVDELVVCGYTAYSTFKHLDEAVERFLNTPRHQLYVLIMDPAAPDTLMLQEQEKVDLRAEIEGTLRLIEQHPEWLGVNLHVRLMSQAPTFTATLMNGDITSMEEGRPPRDSHGRIRLQPRRQFGTVHVGVVIQFAKLPDAAPAPFDYYVDELRHLWRQARPAYAPHAPHAPDARTDSWKGSNPAPMEGV